MDRDGEIGILRFSNPTAAIFIAWISSMH